MAGYKIRPAATWRLRDLQISSDQSLNSTWWMLSAGSGKRNGSDWLKKYRQLTNEHHVFSVFPMKNGEKWWLITLTQATIIGIEMDWTIWDNFMNMFRPKETREAWPFGHGCFPCFCLPEPSHLCAVRPKNPFLRWEDPYPSINEAWSHKSHPVHRIRKKTSDLIWTAGIAPMIAMFDGNPWWKMMIVQWI